MERRNFLVALVIAMITGLLVTGCAPDSQDPERMNASNGGDNNTVDLQETTDPEMASARTFKDAEDVEQFVAKFRGSSPGMYFSGGVAETRAMDDAVSASPQQAGGDAGAQRDFSKTNVQEAGIDEADIIKTDGNHIYTISGDTVYIVKAYPGEESEVVTKFTLENTPEGLFLKDDRLAVFGTVSQFDAFASANISPTSTASFLRIYDLSEIANPEVADEFVFEGRYEHGRMLNDTIYLSVMSSPQYRQYPMPYYVAEGTRQHVEPAKIHFYDMVYENPGFATIHSVSMDAGEHLDAASVAVEWNRELYMSDENIYLSYEKQVNEYDLRMEFLEQELQDRLTQTDRELIEKIRNTDDAVLSRSEKQQKISSIYQSYARSLSEEEQEQLEKDINAQLRETLKEKEYLQHTMIHRIAVDDGSLEVAANGRVPGRLLNQFAMDERDGVLRMATTVDDRWSSVSENRTVSKNNVYTLNEDLEVLGSLTGLAEEEDIYSTRFVGDKLYMVTFRQIDPFFVIDLSNPEEPVNQGELKITGFSRYLHPYDNETIIGIGKAATEQGRSLGVKISLFDVSDVNNPQEIASYTTESDYSNSNVLFEHKAFLFDRQRNLLVIPAHSYESDFWIRREGEQRREGANYNGAMVFNITKDDISLRGLIDHSMADESNYYRPLVERSLYIEELLYTKSSQLLRINALDDLHSVKNITLRTSEQDEDLPRY